MPTLPDRILETKSLREQVYEYLRETLSTGALEPGDSIRIDDLSDKLGVSRTPLREALLQLDWEGFIIISPRRGIRVRRLYLCIIRHLYEIIGALDASIQKEIEEAVVFAEKGRDP